MRIFFTIIFLVACLLLQTACQEPEPIRIGFLGGLTTRAAGLSTSGRDGFQLAIEEINASGGVNNRQIKGLIQDTRGHKETSLQAVHLLAQSKVAAIIGPMTSQTAVTVVPEANRAKTPMISPTVSTNQLSGIDDYFFRVYYTNAQAAELLAERLSTREDVQRIAVIYDLGNRAYTEDWIKHFQGVLEHDDSSEVVRIPFDIRSETLFLELATRAVEAEPQAVLILANAVDTAMVCQQLAKMNIDLPRYATGWSYSDDLLQFGGKSVEGLLIIQSADFKDPAPGVQRFVEAYRKRFRTEPNFPALHAYDATMMVFKAMQTTTDPKAIREELLKLEHYAGLQADLAVDRYGDLKNPRLHLAKIRGGQFVNAD
jgi:branched-chain amino acid transport system substrate-binding protein